MTTSPSKDAPLANLDKVVQDCLAYFDGPGRASSARVDRWQARDILMHFLYFHDATAWGSSRSRSVDRRGPCRPTPTPSTRSAVACTSPRATTSSWPK